MDNRLPSVTFGLIKFCQKRNTLHQGISFHSLGFCPRNRRQLYHLVVNIIKSCHIHDLPHRSFRFQIFLLKPTSAMQFEDFCSSAIKFVALWYRSLSCLFTDLQFSRLTIIKGTNRLGIEWAHEIRALASLLACNWEKDCRRTIFEDVLTMLWKNIKLNGKRRAGYQEIILRLLKLT